MKKKIRDLSLEEYEEWKEKNCYKTSCMCCPFDYSNCKENTMHCWFSHREMFSDKFLDQEVDIPSLHILDKEEHDYLRAVVKPYKVKYICKLETQTGNQFIEIVVKSSVYGGLTGSCSMPCFKLNSMYKNMEVNKEYTIEELELDKEWEE